MEALGFPVEARNYVPHVTVAKISYPQKITLDVSLFLNSTYDPIDLEVDRVQFLHSETMSSETIYTLIKSFPLGENFKEKMSTETKKSKALELAITQIDRQFGKGSIMRLGDDHVQSIDNSISTGCLSLDVALGVGGVPKGRIIEIYGPESSGKTTLALHIVAEAQKVGGFAAYIDAEHAVDPEYSKKLGVNTEDLLISQPDTGEQALEICETLVRSGALDVIVIDSVAKISTKGGT